MARIRKKLNKSAIILLAVIAIAGIALVVCHFVGVIDLSFVGAYAQMLGTAMEESAYVAGGAIVGLLIGGVLLGFWLKDYIIGVDTANATITQTTNSQGYNPAPITPTVSGNTAGTVS